MLTQDNLNEWKIICIHRIFVFSVVSKCPCQVSVWSYMAWFSLTTDFSL